jgi:serine/threonine protein kinase
VVGHFPFKKKASKSDRRYKLIMRERYQEYWELNNHMELSAEFMALVMSMMSYDPNKRPTIEEIRDHPWMTKEEVDIEKDKKIIYELLKGKNCILN